MTEQSWIGTPEAAARLGVGAQDVYRLIDQGRIPAYRFGRVIRIRAIHLDEFVEQQEPDEAASPAATSSSD